MTVSYPDAAFVIGFYLFIAAFVVELGIVAYRYFKHH